MVADLEKGVANETNWDFLANGKEMFTPEKIYIETKDGDRLIIFLTDDRPPIYMSVIAKYSFTKNIGVSEQPLESFTFPLKIIDEKGIWRYDADGKPTPIRMFGVLPGN